MASENYIIIISKERILVMNMKKIDPLFWHLH